MIAVNGLAHCRSLSSQFLIREIRTGERPRPPAFLQQPQSRDILQQPHLAGRPNLVRQVRGQHGIVDDWLVQALPPSGTTFRN